MSSKISVANERMCLCCRPFWWPCRCIEAKHVARPNATCPGLHWKSLDAAIGRLLAPYRPGSHHGDNQQNDNSKCTHFAGYFDCHYNVAVITRTLLDGGGSWLSYKPLKAAIGWALAPILPIGHTSVHFIVNKGSSGHVGPYLITIGVWHIKLMGTT